MLALNLKKSNNSTQHLWGNLKLELKKKAKLKEPTSRNGEKKTMDLAEKTMEITKMRIKKTRCTKKIMKKTRSPYTLWHKYRIHLLDMHKISIVYKIVLTSISLKWIKIITGAEALKIEAEKAVVVAETIKWEATEVEEMTHSVHEMIETEVKIRILL